MHFGFDEPPEPARERPAAREGRVKAPPPPAPPSEHCGCMAHGDAYSISDGICGVGGGLLLLFAPEDAGEHAWSQQRNTDTRAWDPLWDLEEKEQDDSACEEKESASIDYGQVPRPPLMRSSWVDDLFDL